MASKFFKSFSLLLLLATIGCGSPSSHDPLGPTGGPPSTGLFQVRLAPQSPDPVGLKGVSFAEPGSLAALPAPRSVSDLADEMNRDGSSFDTGLPHNRATALGGSVVLNPSWDAAGSNTLADIAYCTYKFNLAGYTDRSSFGLSWAQDGAPAEWDTLWVALGNLTADRWDWYSEMADGVLTVASFTDYMAPTGEVLVLIASSGAQPCILEGITAGTAEVRPLGDSGLSAAPDNIMPPTDASGGLPASFDLTGRFPEVHDQATWGSCTAFAVGDAAYNFDLGKLYGDNGWDFSDDFNLVSPKHLYVVSGELQGFPPNPAYGRYTDQVIADLVDHGVATEANAPYNLAYDDNWSGDALADAEILEIADWWSISPYSADGIQSIKAVLATAELPVVMRIDVDADFMYYSPGEVWQFGGPALGGHAMCIVGYDDAKQAFKVRNSWSEQWGEGGYCWIGYQTFVGMAANAWCWVMYDEYDPAAVNRFCGGVGGLSPPTGVQASDGSFGDRIRVNWNKSPGATEYIVSRDQPGTIVASLGDVNSWDDTLVAGTLGHTYWVRAKQGTTLSNLSNPNVGYLAQAPQVTNVSPQAGQPAQEIQFFISAYGSDPLTYSWDFGGGANPNTSADRSPSVTLSASEGTFAASVEVSNSLGTHTYDFELLVDDGVGANTAPVADLTATPASGAAPLLVTLDASASFDNEGTIAKFMFDPASDDNWQDNGVDPTLDHTYGVPGNYTARVQVYDGENLVDEASILVAVSGSGSWQTHTIVNAPTSYRCSLAEVDGMPAVAFRTDTGSSLNYIRASSADGSTWGTALTLDTAGSPGYCLSLAVVNGIPAVSYIAEDDDMVRFVRGTDAEGSGWAAPVDVINSNADSKNHSPTWLLDSGGNPGIAYFDRTGPAAKWIRASASDGSAWGLPLTVADTGDVDECYLGATLVEGRPALTFWNESYGGLRYSRAVDAAGSAFDTPHNALFGGREFSSLTLIDGLPAVIGGGTFGVRYRRAADLDGTSWATPADFAGAATGRLTSYGDLPLVIYMITSSQEDLYERRGTDADATGVTGEVQIDHSSVSFSNLTSATVIGGAPAVAYFDSQTGNLMYAVYN